MKHDLGTLWHKSSYSTHQGGDCVEVAELPGKIGVRDSKNPSGHVHTFGKGTFSAFVRAIRAEHHQQ